jgi:hypothetical protein
MPNNCLLLIKRPLFQLPPLPAPENGPVLIPKPSLLPVYRQFIAGLLTD